MATCFLPHLALRLLTMGGIDKSTQPPNTPAYPPSPIISSTWNNLTGPKRLILQRPDQFWADLVDEVLRVF